MNHREAIQLNTTQRALVDKIIQAASGRSPGEQIAIAEDMAAGDQSVYREAVSLLHEMEKFPSEELRNCPIVAPRTVPSSDDEDLRPTSDHPPGLPNPAQEVRDVSLAQTDYRPGSRIGPYKLISELGEGGFGIVYLAERIEPARQFVALKVIKPGMGTKEVLARFEQERQALAVMDHACIAKMFDGGVTELGQPYFVMEYVKGEPITRYCDRHRLGLRERIELFIKVCEAVQHAHMKGVIHRDLKPSNILIEYEDGDGGSKPAPKVIDFGVAKALNQRMTERTIFTEQGKFIGTPEYISPEQAEMSGLDIDTRADVYSLGVLLYELLSGTLPFDPKTLREAGFYEIQRIIREVDPPKPSTRLSAWRTNAHRPSSHGQETRDEGRTERGSDASRKSAGDLDSVTRQRSTDTRSLLRALRGDLDWVVMKCLEKERSRRYEAPTALAGELRRYLNNEPVTAGPPSAVYRMRKFVRRNRASVVTGGIVAASLIVATIVSGTFAFSEAEQRRIAESNAVWALAEADRARQAEDHAHNRERVAREVLHFLNVDLLRAATPDESPSDTKVVDLVLQASQSVDRRFHDDPVVRAEIHLALGDTLLALSMFDDAERHIRKAVSLYEDWEPRSVRYLLARLSEAELLYRQRDAGRASEIAMDAWDNLAALDNVPLLTLSAAAHHIANAKKWLGSKYREDDRPDLAESTYEAALTWYERAAALLHDADGANDSEEHDSILYNKALLIMEIGYLLRQSGQTDAAMEQFHLARDLLEAVVEWRLAEFGKEHPRYLRAMSELGLSVALTQDYKTAQQIWEIALEGQRRNLQQPHWRTLSTMDRLARVYLLQGHIDEGIALMHEAYHGYREVKGPDAAETMQVLKWYAAALDQHHDTAEALEVLTSAYDDIKYSDSSNEAAARRIACHALSLVAAVDDHPDLNVWQHRCGQED